MLNRKARSNEVQRILLEIYYQFNVNAGCVRLNWERPNLLFICVMRTPSDRAHRHGMTNAIGWITRSVGVHSNMKMIDPKETSRPANNTHTLTVVLLQ